MQFISHLFNLERNLYAHIASVTCRTNYMLHVQVQVHVLYVKLGAFTLRNDKHNDELTL